jgi:hypothetical protein
MLNSMAMSILFLLFSLSERNLSFTFYSVRRVHGPTLKSPVSFFFVHVYFLQPACSWCACIEASSQSLLCTRAYKSPISVVFVCVHWSLQLLFSLYTCIEVSSQNFLYTRVYKSPISVFFVHVHWSLQSKFSLCTCIQVPNQRFLCTRALKSPVKVFFVHVHTSPQSAFSLYACIEVSSYCSISIRTFDSPVSIFFVCVHWSLQTAYFFLYVRWSPQSVFSLHSCIDVSSQCSFWNAQLTRYIRNSNFHLSLSCDRM